MSTHHLAPVDQDAWYRQFYVWLIIVLPACAIVASFATLYVAAKDPPDLVVDDYSRIEAIVTRNAAQDARAAQLGLQAEVTFGTEDTEGTLVEIRILANERQPLPKTIVLRARHSTRAAQDAEAILEGTDGFYQGRLRLPAGRYDLFVEATDSDWRLTTRVLGRPESLLIRADFKEAAAVVQAP